MEQTKLTTLGGLPPELLLRIAEQIESSRDLSSLARTSKKLYFNLEQSAFDLAVKIDAKIKPLEQSLIELFIHCLKRDSEYIATYLINSKHRINWNGSIGDALENSLDDVATLRLKRRRMHIFDGLWNVQKPLHSQLPADYTFLHFAIAVDSPKVVAALIQNGASFIPQPGVNDHTVGHLCETVSQRLPDVSALNTALRTACSNGFPRTAHFLLEKGADPNALDDHGFSALHITVSRRQAWTGVATIGDELKQHLGLFTMQPGFEQVLHELVLSLLYFGADVNLRDESSPSHTCTTSCWGSLDCTHRGQTALHYALTRGTLPVSMQLVEHGASVNIPDGQGFTPLYIAIAHGFYEEALHMIDKCGGENAMASVQDRSTVLHIAYQFKADKIVEKLLEYGPDVKVVDIYGRRPGDYVEKRKKTRWWSRFRSFFKKAKIS